MSRTEKLERALRLLLTIVEAERDQATPNTDWSRLLDKAIEKAKPLIVG